MEATLPLFAPETLDPYRGECPGCGVEVLAVDLDGREAVVDVAEVLPRFECPQCSQVRGRGHQRSSCLRCGDTGWIGEDLPLRGVAIAEDGSARSWRRGQAFAEGEALHLHHGHGIMAGWDDL